MERLNLPYKVVKKEDGDLPNKEIKTGVCP
jgi:hypothetical protein